MSALDPCLGTYNAWRGDEVLQSVEPTLYHAASVYACSSARLALLEHASPWRSRCVDFYFASMSVEQARAAAAETHAKEKVPVEAASGARRRAAHRWRTLQHTCGPLIA